MVYKNLHKDKKGLGLVSRRGTGQFFCGSWRPVNPFWLAGQNGPSQIFKNNIHLKAHIGSSHNFFACLPCIQEKNYPVLIWPGSFFWKARFCPSPLPGPFFEKKMPVRKNFSPTHFNCRMTISVFFKNSHNYAHNDFSKCREDRHDPWWHKIVWKWKGEGNVNVWIDIRGIDLMSFCESRGKFHWSTVTIPWPL